jgi:hypothetical protein
MSAGAGPLRIRHAGIKTLSRSERTYRVARGGEQTIQAERFVCLNSLLSIVANWQCGVIVRDYYDVVKAKSVIRVAERSSPRAGVSAVSDV